MDWFEAVNQRGGIVEGQVADFRVTLNVGFKTERAAERLSSGDATDSVCHFAITTSARPMDFASHPRDGVEPHRLRVIAVNATPRGGWG
jgi:hypothetical protein